MHWYLTTPSDELRVAYNDNGQLSVGGCGKIQDRHDFPNDAGFVEQHNFLSASRGMRFRWSIVSRDCVDIASLRGKVDFLQRMFALQPSATHAIASFVSHGRNPDGRGWVELINPYVTVDLYAPDAMFSELRSLSLLAMQLRSPSVRISLEMIGFDRRVQLSDPRDNRPGSELNVEDAEVAIWDAAPWPLTDDFLTKDFEKNVPAFGWFRWLSLINRTTSGDAEEETKRPSLNWSD